MPIKTGKDYIERVNRARPKVLYRGRLITEDISEHVAFRGLVATQAALYDLQGDETYRECMTYNSPSSGQSVGLSFLPPKTRNDLERRRRMMAIWAKHHHGFLGRSPDYMNTALMAYSCAADVLSELNPEFAQNLKDYYVYCREHDITLSHALNQPVASRISMIYDSIDKSIGAKVHELNQDGMVVSGAFHLATQAVTAEELFVFPAPMPSCDEGVSPYTFAFAVPNNLPGITFVCRESYVLGDNPFDYPLSSRFEEMDTLVLFDHVLVPRNRIFLYGDAQVAERFNAWSNFRGHVSHQVLCRYIAKTEFILGLVELMEKVNGPTSRPFFESIVELTTILEVLKSFLVRAEMDAQVDRWGNLLINPNTALVAGAYFPKVYPRMLEIVQTLSGSKLIMLPSEADFVGEEGRLLNEYLKLYDCNGHDVAQVYRLAWELSASSFAGRQTQYERFFFGGPGSLEGRLYDDYANRTELLDQVKRFLGVNVSP